MSRCLRNFHTFLAFETDEELQAVRGLVRRMAKRALALDGACKSCALGGAIPGSALAIFVSQVPVSMVSGLGRSSWLRSLERALWP